MAEPRIIQETSWEFADRILRGEVNEVAHRSRGWPMNDIERAVERAAYERALRNSPIRPQFLPRRNTERARAIEERSHMRHTRQQSVPSVAEEGQRGGRIGARIETIRNLDAVINVVPTPPSVPKTNQAPRNIVKRELAPDATQATSSSSSSSFSSSSSSAS